MIKESVPDYIYYYDMTEDEVRELHTMLYTQALNFKINKAKILLEELVAVDLNKRDFCRMNYVQKAISFNNELINECKY